MVVYVCLVIPETKNKTFLEIQNDFQSSNNRKARGADGAGTTLLSTPMWNITNDSGVEQVKLFSHNIYVTKMSNCHEDTTQ